MERKKIDWEKIEIDYRAGMLSVREIARQNDITEGAIRKEAKRSSWERDLTAQVQKAVRNKPVRKTQATDKEIVEEKVGRGYHATIGQHLPGLTGQPLAMLMICHGR